VEITYTLTEDDWLAYHMHAWGKLRRRRWSRTWQGWPKLLGIVVALSGGVAVVALLYTFAIFWDSWGLAILLVFYFAVLVLGWLALRQNAERGWRRRVRRAVRRNVQTGVIRLERQFRVLITPEALTEIIESRRGGLGVRITERSESVAGWHAITEVEETEKFGVLQVGAWGACLIPKHAVEDEESFQDVMRAVELYRRRSAQPGITAGSSTEQAIKQADRNIRRL
jgi:hypothetical protein